MTEETVNVREIENRVVTFNIIKSNIRAETSQILIILKVFLKYPRNFKISKIKEYFAVYRF